MWNFIFTACKLPDLLKSNGSKSWNGDFYWHFTASTRKMRLNTITIHFFMHLLYFQQFAKTWVTYFYCLFNREHFQAHLLYRCFVYSRYLVSIPHCEQHRCLKTTIQGYYYFQVHFLGVAKLVCYVSSRLIRMAQHEQKLPYSKKSLAFGKIINRKTQYIYLF